ncbi:MAG: hypothetical protein HOM14_21160 [Gammaproteobacteria bacterium]|jgi:hypothetical protein|nr:hypothetical protein [Gammaproteobacteria bacterium]MBT3725356.1 hypothetical protein [Gammaproteobacteria bacterium]MBT4194839.1 hypothetical protein [Gammaproteobacteria bacterium]MBT4450992.1 hypothetical protein [Gammaproteobacteria bacterium]MBT4861741.1 hypothetical protein [Gammaproteobacteria bacterium]
MFLSPAILALIMVSAVISLMLVLAGGFSIQLLRLWDINSGSELQLNLERRTYLISTLLAWAFASELVSLMLFIYNAESMSGQFVGAMCATGVLNVNEWGWPTLFLKIAIFFSGTIWLALNYLDNKGFDYPLVRIKYFLLLLIIPMVFTEFYTQTRYFLEMDPDVITSCCGSLFSVEAKGVAAEVSSLSPRDALIAMYGTGLLTILTGTWYLFKKTAGLLFSLSGIAAFIAALMSIISYISLYIYEHPHHHCPFCILKSGHDYAGYSLYIPLFLATALALAAGSISLWRKIPSLNDSVEIYAPKLVYAALIFFNLFYALATWWVWQSNLTMESIWQ